MLNSYNLADSNLLPFRLRLASYNAKRIIAHKRRKINNKLSNVFLVPAHLQDKRRRSSKKQPIGFPHPGKLFPFSSAKKQHTPEDTDNITNQDKRTLTAALTITVVHSIEITRALLYDPTAKIKDMVSVGTTTREQMKRVAFPRRVTTTMDTKERRIVMRSKGNSSIQIYTRLNSTIFSLKGMFTNKQMRIMDTGMDITRCSR